MKHCLHALGNIGSAQNRYLHIFVTRRRAEAAIAEEIAVGDADAGEFVVFQIGKRDGFRQLPARLRRLMLHQIRARQIAMRDDFSVYIRLGRFDVFG